MRKYLLECNKCLAKFSMTLDVFQWIVLSKFKVRCITCEHDMEWSVIRNGEK